MTAHVPVLVKEVIEGLNIKPDGVYVDLTVGRGGHSEAILSRLTTGRLIAVDQDLEAIETSNQRLAKISKNFVIKHTNFSNFEEILKEENVDEVDGILMDLGVSSPQFDEGHRGFSYRLDAQLDMRMDQRQPLTASHIVNEYSLQQLTKIFKDYGEERFAYSIAKNIIKSRTQAPIETTLQLVDIIKKSKPMKQLKKVGHPAKQVFQALRIAVNDELNVLQHTLSLALKYLKPDGRLGVITFHSGEDRIVKTIFRNASIVEGDRLDGPHIKIEKPYYLINRRPITPTKSELKINHRAASAKLRIIARKKGEHNHGHERQIN
ncbi:MAG: 16S rRNA (cytosine(1402)-N(4))-methyltransferase RsmH [Erysipelotrichia bacterium]|nr:16S rRNA (cytosine(1402)-N(4))-methyltransferase RsmH [Erysipelotrichia bacterium]